ncbi:MAG: quinolinate synthase NadA [Candidatus Lokiarchaeota archaeon]|nr:quinolinate synthase NadA [Candidatus Lokiarchaeota archaeon]MBD3339886.1 quinolinate synthase NadA [Candidatus Lokiarchaeota archaeon]
MDSNLNDLQKEILKLKNQKNVTILAHYYQPIEIQEVADYLGDSLGLSRIARDKTKSKYIIFAGVKFMAETASILNQDKKVLVPTMEACCALADFLNAKQVINYKQQYPGVPAITYVNSTAEVKAESDCCCTSSNAAKIVKKMAKKQGVNKVLFGPDSNLASYVQQQLPKIEIIKMPETGHCYVHSQITPQDIDAIKKKYQNAKLLVHPECKKEVRERAEFVGSTAQMYNYVKNTSKKSNGNEFIIGTEKGLLERMQKDFPSQKFYLAINQLICRDMKNNNTGFILKILNNLDKTNLEVKVPKDIARKAMIPLDLMLKYS